ncbi:uncharacterized protein LOC119767484 isoform X3 [Culex quinquefasciatus]|uniref:uncharacterized protein LOC119767484 isoform X3 n=1 Tax=Culex quinquefasciatus TaxID=7176 RepID=UPI0018E2BC45|nr:uncharacterized protein LOC119767484 isoform X3 [Culex quinquefasciatus]
MFRYVSQLKAIFKSGRNLHHILLECKKNPSFSPPQGHRHYIILPKPVVAVHSIRTASG